MNFRFHITILLFVIGVFYPSLLFAQSNRTMSPELHTSSNPSTNTDDVPTKLTTSQEIVIQLREIGKAIKTLQEQQKIQVAASLLQAQQARLVYLESRIATLNMEIATLKDQQVWNEKRSENIQNELVGRAIIDQREGERQVRAEIEAEKARIQKYLSNAEQEFMLIQPEYNQVKSEIEQIKSQIWSYLRASSVPAND